MSDTHLSILLAFVWLIYALMLVLPPSSRIDHAFATVFGVGAMFLFVHSMVAA